MPFGYFPLRLNLSVPAALLAPEAVFHAFFQKFCVQPENYFLTNKNTHD